MTQGAIFRTVCRGLKRTLFACVLCVFVEIGTALAASDICTITLNPNNGTLIREGGDSSSSTNVTKTLYSQYGDGAYKTNTNGVLSDKMTSQSGLADTPPSPALGIPVGLNRTITFDAQNHAPTNPITGGRYIVTDPNSSVQQRNFIGYYSEIINPLLASQNVNKQYIDADGYITSYGQSVAESIEQNNGECPTTTWFALYDCPTVFLPYIHLDGYTFIRWRTADGTTSLGMGVYYSEGRNHPLCYDENLNAVWQVNTYTISYNLAGGDWDGNSTPNTSVNYNIELTVPNPTRAGYTFAGWTITGMDGVTHYYSANPIISNGVYQSSTTQTTTNTQLSGITQTQFMNLRSTTGTVTFTANWTQDTYTLTYVLSNAPNGVNAPSAETVPVGEHNLQDVPSGNGYTCSAWTCETTVGDTSVPVTNNAITMSADTTCSSTCSANTINLIWDPVDADNPEDITPLTTCEYGSTTGTGVITNIQQPSRAGYTFAGWVVRDWNNTLLETFDVSSDGGNCYAYRHDIGACQGMYTGYAWCQSFTRQYCPTASASYAPGNWMVGFDYGAIRGEAVCATNSATQYATGSPDIDNNNGQYCWCRVNSFITKDSLIEEQYNLSWVYLEDIGGQGGSCKNSCARNCTFGAKQNATFRSALYGQSE